MNMAGRPFGPYLRALAIGAALFCAAGLITALPARAAPDAAYLMDARTGETLYESNADTPLHPASLTKMLTLYIAFEEIERGRLSLDSMITVSKNAAAQPPTRLGLKAGQKVQLRYLIRAAAIKSANDAAQAIGDAIGGNQAEFALRMTRTARALGMKNSTFKNANGLTAKGHLSTARDMTILGRRLFYDFPQYYNIFSRRQTDAGLAEVANTNRKFLDAYKGADGIKTGYTGPAGYNLTASAERGNVRLIASVFGGSSTADRNAKMAKLLDRGFAMAKGDVNAVPPPPPQYQNADDEAIVAALPDDGLPEGGEGASAKTVRAIMTLKSSPHPMPRPDFSEIAGAAEDLVAGMADGIAGALAEATLADATGTAAEGATLPFAIAQEAGTPSAVPQLSAPSAAAVPEDGSALASLRPAPRPFELSAAQGVAQIDPAAIAPPSDTAAPAEQTLAQNASIFAKPDTLAAVAEPPPSPPKRKAPIYDTAALPAMAQDTPPAEIAALGGVQPSKAAPKGGEVINRLSTSGGKHWGVNVGRFASSDAAERILVKMQLIESATLGDSLRKVTQKGGGFDANFLGLTEEAAALSCRRLLARAIPCIALGP